MGFFKNLFLAFSNKDPNEYLYETVEVTTCSGKAVFKPAFTKEFIAIEWGVTGKVIDRDEFKLCRLLDEESKECVRSYIDGLIQSSLLGWTVVFEENGYPRFHEILDIDMKKVTISDTPVHQQVIIKAIEDRIFGDVQKGYGVKFNCFNLQTYYKYVPPKQRPLKELKRMRRQYIDIEDILERGIEVHGTPDIKVVFIPFEDHIHIQWDYNKSWLDPEGSIKIYRREMDFAKDELSEVDNGWLVADSPKTKSVFIDEDKLDPNISYCYTVHFKHKKPTEVSTGIFSKEKVIKTECIARMRLKLCEPEPVEEQPEKSPIEILKEQQTTEREEQIVTHYHDREKMFNDLKACIKNKESTDAFITVYKEECLNKIKATKGRVSKEDRESVEKIIEDLEDRAHDMLSDLKDK